MIDQKVIWIALVAYMAFLCGVAISVTVKERKIAAGGGSQLTTTVKAPVLIMTYIASLMSTWVFFAGPGAYYRGGLVYYMSELSYICMFPIVAHFSMNKVWLVNKAMGNKFVTPADFYDARFKSPTLRVILACIFMVASFPYIASVLVAIANAAQYATDGQISYKMMVIVVGLIMTVFMMTGGVKSAATADMFQGIAIIAMLWLIVICCLIVGFGGSLAKAASYLWNDVAYATGASDVHGSYFFAYPGPSAWTSYAGRFGYPFSCAIGWTIMLPHVFVRSGYFGDSMKTQRKLSLLGPVLQAVVWTGTMILGMLGLALLPGLDSSQSELIILELIGNVVNNFSVSLAKVLTVAFFIGSMAVGLSTANAFLSVSTSIVYEDFIKKTFRIKVKKEAVVVRVITAIIGIGSLCFALNPPQLIYTLIMFAIAIVMPLLPVLLFGVYWKRATKQAAIVASIVGTVLVLMSYFVWDIGNTWYGFFGFLGSIACMIIVSLATKQDPKDSEEFYKALHDGHNTYYQMPSNDLV